MPAYDYICYPCNRKVEVVKSMRDYGEPVYCQQCGERLTRFWGKAPGITYRGEGWTGAQRRAT